jgi:hypothetical protein
MTKYISAFSKFGAMMIYMTLPKVVNFDHFNYKKKKLTILKFILVKKIFKIYYFVGALFVKIHQNILLCWTELNFFFLTKDGIKLCE